jgi:hypothetical protein
MKTLLLFISFFIIAADAATVRLYFTDPLTNEKDTNAFYITPVGTNVLSNGGVVGRGVTTRYVPASDGYRTNTLAVGHYSITNRSLGSGVVIRVPESSSLYDYTNLLISGYNIFVTVTNGSGGGTSGALTNNDTRSIGFSDDLTVQGTISAPLNPIIGYSFIGDGTGLTNLTAAIAADTVVSNGIVTGLAAGSYAVDGGALIFSELYSAWVSKYGDNSTGTVGKRERPFAGVSNAVYAVKTALGSVNTNGVVYVGSGLFGEHYVNLARTNLPGISLIGNGAATMLTSVSTSSLTNLGALVTVGHSTRVIGVCISNDVNCTYKQSAIGWDTGRDVAVTGTLVASTNVFINIPFARGNSDIAYFYDAGAGVYDITLAGCDDWISKWDTVFLNTAGTDGTFQIVESNIKVIQPDGYDFPGGGSGGGRARTVYIGEGYLSVINSTVTSLGGNNTTNETTAITFFGATVGYTNIGSFVDAQSSGSGTVTLELTSEPTQYLGKLNAAAITGTFTSITNSGKYNGIKVYRATITQTGTAAPVATVLENSLGATPTWARTGVGTYTVNTSSLFTSGKTVTQFHQSTSSSGGFHLGTIEWATASQIILRTVDDAQVGGLADAILNNGSSIEILVYP